MSASFIKVAVVGLGGMGRHHAKAVLENSRCQLKYVSDLNSAALQEFRAQTENLCAQESSFENIISDSDLQVVCLASYDDIHAQQVIAAMAAGKHIYVEKPLCQNENELRAICEGLRKSRIQLISNLVLRTAPLYQYIQDIISSGALGEIYAFDGDYLYGRIQKIIEGWRRDAFNYSVMEGGGIHMVDLMMWLTGQKPVSVTTHVNKITTRDTAFRYHDFQSSMFSFASGMIGRITANFGCVHKHQHVVRVFGTKGTFIYDDRGARIHWSRDPENTPEFIERASKPAQKAQLFHVLVDAIQNSSASELAQREFDLMSVVLASDAAVGKYKEIEYLTC